MALPADIRIDALGDSALVLRLPAAIDEATNERVHALAAWIVANIRHGILDLVPAYHTLTVHYHPWRYGFEELAERIRAAEPETVQAAFRARTVSIPVCYDPRLGPDLPALAAHCRLSEDEVVRRHSGADYRVFFLGFKPGFAYLGGLHASLYMPRHDTPRLRVPAGAVGIGGAQTGIYPDSSPGGWQLIGRTPLRLFDPEQTPPSLLQAGDHVRFEPIDFDAYRELGGQC